jgi:hypothetical protein
MKSIDRILNELGMETPELPPMNRREAIEAGLVTRKEGPIKGECGKSAYPSQSSADAAIKHRLRQGFGGTSFLRSYYCQECGAWHMSSSHNKKNK